MAESSNRASIAKLGAAAFSSDEPLPNPADTPAHLADAIFSRNEPPPYTAPPATTQTEQFEDIELHTFETTGSTRIPIPPAREQFREEPGMQFYKPRPDPKRPFFIGTIGVLFTALLTVSSLLGVVQQAKAKCEMGPKTVTATVTDTSTLTPSTESVTLTKTQVSTSIVSTTLTTTDTETETMTDLSTTTATPTITLVTSTVVTSFSFGISVLPSTAPAVPP